MCTSTWKPTCTYTCTVYAKRLIDHKQIREFYLATLLHGSKAGDQVEKGTDVLAKPTTCKLTSNNMDSSTYELQSKPPSELPEPTSEPLSEPSELLSEPPEPPSELLNELSGPSSEPCHVVVMIVAKNGAMTTATAAMTTGRKAR